MPRESAYILLYYTAVVGGVLVHSCSLVLFIAIHCESRVSLVLVACDKSIVRAMLYRGFRGAFFFFFERWRFPCALVHATLYYNTGTGLFKLVAPSSCSVQCPRLFLEIKNCTRFACPRRTLTNVSCFLFLRQIFCVPVFFIYLGLIKGSHISDGKKHTHIR